MIRYSDELIDEIKNNNDIVDVISQYVHLKRSGRNYFGLCPFHNEKSPSFAVSPDKQIFHCFGCGVGGNVIHFISKIEGINFRESIRNFAGVRARTADHDFHIYEDKNNKGFINIAGMQSPGLSSACAIAPDILKMLENSGLTLEAKEDIVDERHIDRFKHLSHEDREKLVEKNPAFGKIICRCETITEGEIINAVHRPIPATSIDAVKRRCNAGMGRCQGGFCGPRVQEIIARELNKPLADIPQDRLGTNIITGETKDGGAK